MPTLSLCLALLSAPEWATLPLPSLCLPPPGVQALARRVDAAHIQRVAVQPGAENSASSGSTELTRMPIGILTRQLEEAARAAGGKLAVQPSGPELFVEGDAPGLAAARAWLADLEAQTSALRIELAVTLSTEVGQPGIEERAEVLPGDWISLGRREKRDFLGDFDVEVAQDSGAADPVLMQTLEGAMLELSVRTLDSSRELVIVGALDISRVIETASFEPGTLDLGQLELPRLRVASLCFADTLPEGGKLELSLEMPGSQQPWRLSVEARRARPAAAAPDKLGWQIVDLSALSLPAQRLPAIAPGGSLDEELERNLARPRETHVEAGAIASWLARDASSGSKLFGSSSSAPGQLFTDSLLFLPRADPQGLARARELLAALEQSRRLGGRLRVQQGGLKAEFPILVCEPARLRFGTEYALLRDYQIEIAGQTWMPDPVLDVLFDGLVLDAQSQGSAQAQLLAVITSGSEARTLARTSAWAGALQANQRSIRARHWLQAAEARVQFEADARLETVFRPR